MAGKFIPAHLSSQGKIGTEIPERTPQHCCKDLLSHHINSHILTLSALCRGPATDHRLQHKIMPADPSQNLSFVLLDGKHLCPPVAIHRFYDIFRSPADQFPLLLFKGIAVTKLFFKQAGKLFWLF
jgi:hypothetical protein